MQAKKTPPNISYIFTVTTCNWQFYLLHSLIHHEITILIIWDFKSLILIIKDLRPDLCIFRRNVTFDANVNQYFQGTKCSDCSSWRERLQIILEKCLPSKISRLSSLFFLLEKMNYAGTPKLAVDLRIRTPNTGMTQIIVVFKANIGTRGLRMILAIFHLPLPHGPGNSFFQHSYKGPSSDTLLTQPLARHNTCIFCPTELDTASR